MMLLAPFSSCCCSCYSSYSKDSPGWENTVAVKDGKAAKLRPKTP